MGAMPRILPVAHGGCQEVPVPDSGFEQTVVLLQLPGSARLSSREKPIFELDASETR